MWETLVIVSVILVYFFTRNQKKEPEEDTEKEIEEEKGDVEETEKEIEEEKEVKIEKGNNISFKKYFFRLVILVLVLVSIYLLSFSGIFYWIGVGILIFFGLYIGQILLGLLLGVKDIRDKWKTYDKMENSILEEGKIRKEMKQLEKEGKLTDEKREEFERNIQYLEIEGDKLDRKLDEISRR
jgi:membrane protein implicated in regulation of membrane protease activity